jgi:hypothetical protein
MNCAGCRRELDVGDQYIEDTASGFLGRPDNGMDDLMAEILGSGKGDKIIYCEDCTEQVDDGRWKLHTVYGDEEEAA